MAISDNLNPNRRMSEPPREASPEGKSSWVGEFLGLGKDIVVAALGAILIVIFVIQPVKVEGTSMEPRLQPQDRLFVNKFVYYLSDVRRGDIVVFWYPRDRSKSFIKRVVGLPGDKVEIRSGMVLVNGQRLLEPYLPEWSDLGSHPLEVIPPRHYFVMGDHRNSSSDSREWGTVPRQNIFGEAVFRYWPLGSIGLVE
ncbi:MAG: signal peptidase I [Acidobacteriota bacterium]